MPQGYCSFPAFLWKTKYGGADSHRKWISKTEYAQNTDLWEKQKVITAMETELSVQHKLHASCRGHQADSEVPCFRQQIEYRIICISEEPDEKYRVRQYVNGRYLFTCLKFVRRNKNVVQVYSAAPATVNEDRLCHDGVLHREEWPWVVPVQQEWTFCPFKGGFDFHASMGHTSEELCADVWQPARMESECVKGEGLTFYFPKEACSPFSPRRPEETLYCWASWQEASYMFIILAEANQIPRYVLVSTPPHPIPDVHWLPTVRR
ncbi:hypothetical protein NP493_1685g00035 [Ridgeia piscesae]|uniref:Uncharacterized protein n=1 Tax=Ridgeia piscesae TaxID=27915 RepID=A0AAD9JVA6_RIDPI|nr:hypothetical protein NP493_1685g00035 [Ridgeia piscesae]